MEKKGKGRCLVKLILDDRSRKNCQWQSYLLEVKRLARLHKCYTDILHKLHKYSTLNVETTAGMKERQSATVSTYISLWIAQIHEKKIGQNPVSGLGKNISWRGNAGFLHDWLILKWPWNTTKTTWVQLYIFCSCNEKCYITHKSPFLSFFLSHSNNSKTFHGASLDLGEPCGTGK